LNGADPHFVFRLDALEWRINRRHEGDAHERVALSATRIALAEEGPPVGCIDVWHEDRVLLKVECVPGPRERPETGRHASGRSSINSPQFSRPPRIMDPGHGLRSCGHLSTAPWARRFARTAVRLT
jgi:hypothetical protein